MTTSAAAALAEAVATIAALRGRTGRLRRREGRASDAVPSGVDVSVRTAIPSRVDRSAMDGEPGRRGDYRQWRREREGERDRSVILAETHLSPQTCDGPSGTN